MLTDWLIFLDLLEENNQNTSFLRLITPITFGIIECHYYSHSCSFGFDSGNGFGSGYDSGDVSGSGYGDGSGFGFGFGDGNGYGKGDCLDYGDDFDYFNDYSIVYDEEH